MSLERLLLTTCALGCLLFCGCALSGRRATAQRDPLPGNSQENPFFVAARDDEAVWERAVDVVHRYFDIARENRLDGVIETRPKTGANLLEPWHKDSVGLASRLEGTLQSIRRRAFVNITPSRGGYLVGVEVLKEREDVHGHIDSSAGAATFQEAKPLQRNLSQVAGESSPSGWITLGRDNQLEERMLVHLQRALQP